PPPTSTPFPYTTLFRSSRQAWTEIPKGGCHTLGCSCPMALLSMVTTARSRGDKTGNVIAAAHPKNSGPRSVLTGYKGNRCSHTRSEEHTSELQSRENLV